MLPPWQESLLLAPGDGPLIYYPVLEEHLSLVMNLASVEQLTVTTDTSQMCAGVSFLTTCPAMKDSMQRSLPADPRGATCHPVFCAGGIRALHPGRFINFPPHPPSPFLYSSDNVLVNS